MSKDHTKTNQPIGLRAGPLTILFEDGGIRYVRLGDREVLRRVYVAVRNRYWETIAGELSRLSIEDEDDAFNISFVMRHRRDEIDFHWCGQITGDRHGTVTFTMDGEAQSTFLRNRIGFCVLHPITECAGQPCTVERVTGELTSGSFPEFIAPHQPFFEMRAVTHEVIPGVRVTVRFEGEVFEMEDQRNWTDASFKTYCTPLKLSFPVEVQQGAKLWQRMTLTLDGHIPAARRRASGLLLSIDQTSWRPMPRIGLGAASHRQSLDQQELRRLGALNLSHVRIDLNLAEDCESELRRVASEAHAINASLEAATFLSDDAENELKRLRVLIERYGAPVSAWLIFHSSEKVTSERWVGLARKHLQDSAPAARFGSGTNLYFTEINRQRPPLEAIDLVCFSINPQVHDSDDLTLVENLEAQAETVRSARHYFGGLPIAVTPLTLKPRFNPHKDMHGFGRPDPVGGLPPSVDVRQSSLFAAAWTLGSLRYLADSGAASVTYFETTGWRGVMERTDGSPSPDLFPSLPGAVYPLYHVLADAGNLAGGEVAPMSSSDPLKVIGLAMQLRGVSRAMLANLSPEIQEVTIEGIARESKVRRLNSDSIEEAIRTPESFRVKFSETLSTDGGSLKLVMQPHEIICVVS
jgi:D-apionolactonase